jgi:hypothetical protein
MQLKNNKEIGTSKNIWLFLLVYVVLILIGFIISGQAHWILFVIIFLIITIFSSMVFWQGYVLPDLGLAKHFSLAKYILLNQFIKSPLILSITNGEIEGDYLLLKKKPLNQVLNIDPKSAVLIEDASNHKSQLLYGVHVLNKNPRIIGVFYLGLRSLQIGPNDKNDLVSKNSHESLAEYHSRINAAEKTKTKLLSGDLIYPSFSVFYRIDSSGNEEKDLDLFLKISRRLNGANISLFSPRELDEYITNEILNFWAAFCENKKRDEILAAFPNTFELSDVKKLGINSRIYLERIY